MFHLPEDYLGKFRVTSLQELGSLSQSGPKHYPGLVVLSSEGVGGLCGPDTRINKVLHRDNLPFIHSQPPQRGVERSDP